MKLTETAVACDHRGCGKRHTVSIEARAPHWTTSISHGLPKFWMSVFATWHGSDGPATREIHLCDEHAKSLTVELAGYYGGDR